MWQESNRRWLPVVGWPHYEVSSDGLVRKAGGDLISMSAKPNGYIQVRLSNPRAMKSVHRLVANAFLPNPMALPVVNHLNNLPHDNRAENLEWCTQKHNLRHAAKQGRMRAWGSRRGLRSPVARLSDDQVRELRSTYAAGGISLEGLGRKFGLSKSSAMRCVNLIYYADVQPLPPPPQD